MSKPVLGVDMDDVLVDFQPALDKFHNRKYGTNFDTTTRQFYNQLYNDWGCTPEEARERVFEFYKMDDHFNMPVVSGAKEALQELQHYSIVIITSRSEEIRGITEEMIARYFPNIFDEIYLTNLYSRDGSTKGSKAVACEELGVDVFIDDHIGYAEDVAATGRSVLLLDYSWNRSAELKPNITRVRSWKEILGLLLPQTVVPTTLHITKE